MSTTSPEPSAALRRTLFVSGSILLTGLGMVLLLRTYIGQQIYWSDYIVIGLFPLLFSQIAVGVMLALFGFFDGLRGGDPYHVMRRPWRAKEETVPLAATAIVIPVFNEEVERVRLGIENMWRSVEKTGQLEHFDFYLCSDSNDADHWVEEECAWLNLCQKLKGFGKIFYRKRRHAINSKSGNVADFCRRWGKRYRYMIVLDADSVMSGETMVRLVRAMEANPSVGILQTQPIQVLGQGLFRRLLQFSGSAYGKIFTQGCSFTQTSSSSYWGHNAIIRVAPFIEHCDLPMLPVPEARGRHVLSHDTVEAALMRRAGYEVWVAYEEGGSWEEGPPNLSDMLKRDRRWCAGNLQHFWFLFGRGIQLGNRLQIWIGLMAYLCSPIWLAFLIAGSFSSYSRARFLLYSAGPEDIGNLSHHRETILLFILTMVLLFLPRVLSILSRLPDARKFGGVFGLMTSTLLETALSVLMAPVLMLFHTLFVLQAVLGWQIKWTTQNRADSGLAFSHCVVLYGWQTLLGIAAQSLAWTYLGTNSYWLLPIFTAWMLAPVTAWVTASKELGETLRSWGLLIIPEEAEMPPELAGLAEAQSPLPDVPPLWSQALLCPYVYAIHLSMVRQRFSGGGDKKPAQSLVKLREKLVAEGPDALKPKEKLRLLWDAETVFWLHQELWSRPGDKLHPKWESLQAESGRSPLLRQYLLASSR
jgi:membrane glycosyltransferase